MLNTTTFRIAVLDLYEGEANEGMRCIRQITDQFKLQAQVNVECEIFDVRLKNEVPDLSFDAYISSGGPGSPLDTEDTEWEQHYFSLMDDIRTYNRQHPKEKKHLLLICHSFQIFCRHYKFAAVSKRRSTAFGVFPIHKTKESKNEALLKSLEDPFYAVDSRDYQITQANPRMMATTGAKVVCIEKDRPHVGLERAIMAIRFDEAIIGMQFHPEADAEGMYRYLVREDKKAEIIEKHGEKKYFEMLKYVNDPEKIKKTYKNIIPLFLNQALTYHLAPVI